MSFLISPAERPPITTLGQTSSLPERVGADILFEGYGGLYGLQRKTTTDLIASVRGEGGDRLGKEIVQMRSLRWAGLILEGTPVWTPEGELQSQHVQWSLRQQWGVEASVQQSGIHIFHTRSTLETVSLCEYLYERSQEPNEVSSLLSRGNARANGWGKRTDKDYAVHFLTAIPGINTVLAGRIFDHFGRLPLTWECDQDDLLSIEGLGKKKVNAILRILS